MPSSHSGLSQSRLRAAFGIALVRTCRNNHVKHICLDLKSLETYMIEFREIKSCGIEDGSQQNNCEANNECDYSTDMVRRDRVLV